MRMVLASVFSICWLIGLGQSFSSGAVDQELAKLSIRDRVEYINEHFYSIYSEDYNNAKKLTAWAASTASERGWKKEQAYALMNHGVVTYLKGEYDLALSSYLQSYDIFDSLQNDQGKAMLFTEMGNYYHKQGHKERAFAFLDSAASLSENIGDKLTLAKSYGMRATMLYQAGRVDDARPYYENTFNIFLEMNDSVGLGYTYLDMALYAQLDGDFQKALDLIDNSTTIRKAIGDRQAIAENLFFLGDTYLRQGLFTKALEYYGQCVAYAKNVTYPDQVRKAYEQMARVHKESGKYDLALMYQDSAYLLKDSLFNMERTRTIEEMQMRYETEKKEQQIAVQDAQLAEQQALILRNNLIIAALVLAAILIVLVALLYRARMKKKQQLELQQRELDYTEAQLNAVIQSQEKERKRFASDLHDGFGQLISVLKMNVASMQNREASPAKKMELFDKSTEILDGMYDELRGICFNLMPHTLVKEGLVPAIKELVGRINSANQLTVEVLVFDFEGRIDDLKEVSLYRIVQEWLNNIMKYSDATTVTIQFTKDESELTLTIEDNGQGFNKDLLINGTGNGWKNINSRANLIKAELDIDTTTSLRGSMLTLNVPLSQPTVTRNQ